MSTEIPERSLWVGGAIVDLEHVSGVTLSALTLHESTSGKLTAMIPGAGGISVRSEDDVDLIGQHGYSVTRYEGPALPDWALDSNVAIIQARLFRWARLWPGAQSWIFENGPGYPLTTAQVARQVEGRPVYVAARFVESLEAVS